MNRLFALVGVLLLSGVTFGADWPGWRGPTGQGQAPDKDLPLTWGGKKEENVLWKAPLFVDFDKVKRDQNQSSPIVSKGRVFVTTSFWSADATPTKEIPIHQVSCIDAKTGAVLWRTKVEPGPWKFTDLRGGYTAPTPVTDGEHVYVVFGSSVIAALDFAGKIAWRKTIEPFNYDVCIGTSPILVGDRVVFQCDQVKQTSRLLAFDKRTGDVKLDKSRPGASFSHSTPVLVEINKKPQLLVAASNAIQGVDPETGEIIWFCTAQGDTASPVFDGAGLVYCDSGRGGPGFAVDPAGKGNVTKTHLKWKVGQVPEGFSSPLMVGENLYRLHSPNVLQCWKLATGESLFKERLEGLETAVSPIATADGRLYLANSGKSYVVKAGPKLEVLAVNDLGDPSRASPAVADGLLYLKGSRYLFCVGKR